MATGSGTGTPVSGASAATLNTIRDRVLAQLEGASGVTAPLPVAASTETLATLRDRVELRLADAGNAIYSTDEIDEAIEEALEQLGQRDPYHAIGTIALSADGREIDISSLTGLIRVERVWWDYDSTTPGYPPNWRQFQVWPGSVLYIDDRVEPSNGDTVRVWYTKMQALKDLNSATATTVSPEDIAYLINGAAGFAAQMRAIELAETLNIDKSVTDRLTKWSDEKLKNFRYGINQKPPAWQRYARAYDQADVDEGIRWALHRYTEVKPDRTIATVTLSAAGREVDISSITDYIEIERVWWDYDSSDPENPPNWRTFELWPGDLLYINDPTEPQSADVVRLWYTRMQSLNGLDGASATSFPDTAETLLITGATGYVAQERVQETPGRSIPRKLREWASQRLREFEQGLRLVARREAARYSGIAAGPALDRWDADESGWR